MTVEARFYCHTINASDARSDADPNVASSIQVLLTPVTPDGKGNEKWAKATPGGSLELIIENPAVYGEFEVGKTYRLLLDDVEKIPEVQGDVPAGAPENTHVANMGSAQIPPEAPTIEPAPASNEPAPAPTSGPVADPTSGSAPAPASGSAPAPATGAPTTPETAPNNPGDTPAGTNPGDTPAS